jgi:hypothetical protein
LPSVAAAIVSFSLRSGARRYFTADCQPLRAKCRIGTICSEEGWQLASGVLGNWSLKGFDMEKKIAGLLGAVATLGAFGAAQAAPMANPAPAEILNANSFADLLEPIPNAAALLQVVDEAGPISTADENVQQAQFFYHHHHHHHHHNQFRRYNGYDYDGPRVVVVPRRFYHHHHHHHHHHHSFYRRDYY